METTRKRFTREHAKLIGIALAAVVLLVVFAQNLEQVQVSILFMRITMPLAVMLILTAVIGYLIGLMSAGVMRRRKAKDAASA